MNRLVKIIFSLLISISIASCSTSDKKSDVARVIILNAFQKPLQARLDSKNQNQQIKLEAFQNSDYLDLSPDLYTLHIISENKKLLKEKLGLAKNEKYTIIFYGDPGFSSEVNQSDFTHTMHFIFQGAENFTKNGYLPGMYVFRDQIKVKQGYSQIRVFNAGLGMTPISIKLKSSGSSQKLSSSLAYPKPMLGKPVSSGRKKVELFLGKSPRAIFSKEFDFQSKKVYTIVVFLKDKKPEFKILKND